MLTMKMLRKAALAVCFLLPSQLLGWDIIPDEIRVPLGSRHVNNQMDVDLNEINPGFALTWDGGWADITAGSMRNSFRNTAAFVTVSRDIWQGDNCSVAGFLGTAHYPELSETVKYQHNGWIPIGGLHTECGNVFIQAMPGRGLIGGPSGKAHSDVILVFGLTLDIGQ
jgi:hypothetical protein